MVVISIVNKRHATVNGLTMNTMSKILTIVLVESIVVSVTIAKIMFIGILFSVIY